MIRYEASVGDTKESIECSNIEDFRLAYEVINKIPPQIEIYSGDVVITGDVHLEV